MRKQTRLFILVIGVFFIFGAILLNYFYFSKVVFTGPISLEMKGIDMIAYKSIDVCGISPTGKKHEFYFQDKASRWKYNYPSFIKSFMINGADSIIKNVSSIIVSSNGVNTQILRQQIEFKHNHIIISDTNINKPTFVELFRCMLKWDEIWVVLILSISVLLFVLVLRLNIKKEIKIKHKSTQIFLLFAIIMGAIHLMIFINNGNILITSGILLLIFSVYLFYLLMFFIVRMFHLSMNLAHLKMIFVSIGVSLVFVEIFMIITGTMSTSWEKNTFFFNKSSYNFENNSWYYVRHSDRVISNDEFCHSRKINSEGLSDKEHKIQKDENEFRIMAIGDSFTEGDGAHKDSTWLKFLEYRLKQYPLRRKIDYINAGVCGSDPLFEFVLFKERLYKYNPDLLVLSVNISDIDDVNVRGGMERFIDDGSLRYNETPWWAWIYNMSHVSRLLFNTILGYNELFIREGDGKFELAENEIFDCILNFQSFCDSKRVNLLVVFHPIKQEIIENKLSLDQVYKRTKSNPKLNVLNMLDYFIVCEGISEDNVDPLYWTQDRHHNAKGYELFAKGVEWKLRQMGILDSLMAKPDSVGLIKKDYNE